VRLQIAVRSGNRSGRVFSQAQLDTVIGQDGAADLHIAATMLGSSVLGAFKFARSL
jgi:hypothetical protein